MADDTSGCRQYFATWVSCCEGNEPAAVPLLWAAEWGRPPRPSYFLVHSRGDYHSPAVSPVNTTHVHSLIHRKHHPRAPINWAVVLRPTRHKIGHFGVVSPSQSPGLVWKKTKLNTTAARIRQTRKTKACLFSKVKTSKGGDKETVKKKR